MVSYREVDLFKVSDIELLREEVNNLKKELQNTRKGLFVRHDTLWKMFTETKDELNLLQKRIEDISPVKVKECEILFV